MKQKTMNFLSNVVFVGALGFAGIYCMYRVLRESEPEAVKPKAVEVKPLEQLALDEKPAVSKNVETGLAVVQPRDSIQFYGERVLQGGKYKQVDKDLCELLVKMADAYKAEFNLPLFVGPMWDDRGHSKNSRHYQGLAVDIDFGANVGTAQYNNADKKKAEFLLNFIRKYEGENNKKFKVLFNDQDFIMRGLCSYFEGHHNHIHIGK